MQKYTWKIQLEKDKDDNTITLQEILESNSKPIEDEVDLKFKIKKNYIIK